MSQYPSQSSAARESAALLAAVDRLADRLTEPQIQEACRQFRNGRASVGPILRALGVDPNTGRRLTSPAARTDTPKRTDSARGYDRSTIELERLKARHRPPAQVINGVPVAPIAAIQVPKKHVPIWSPSTRRG